MMNYINKKQFEKNYVSNNILSSCTITNPIYYYYYKNIELLNIKLKKEGNLSNKLILKDLFEDVNLNVKGIIQTCLKNLNKKYKLNYNYNYILILLQLKDGKIIETTREATYAEIETIEFATKQCINNFNKNYKKKIKNLNDVSYLTKKMKDKFYHSLNTEIFEEIYKLFKVEIKLCFKGYIIKNMDFTEQLKDINIQEVKKKLDNKFVKNTINNLERKVDKKKKVTKIEIDKIDEWGVSEDIREQLGKNRFGYKHMLTISDLYIREYVYVINMLLVDYIT